MKKTLLTLTLLLAASSAFIEAREIKTFDKVTKEQNNLFNREKIALSILNDRGTKLRTEEKTYPTGVKMIIIDAINDEIKALHEPGKKYAPTPYYGVSLFLDTSFLRPYALRLLRDEITFEKNGKKEIERKPYSVTSVIENPNEVLGYLTGKPTTTYTIIEKTIKYPSSERDKKIKIIVETMMKKMPNRREIIKKIMQRAGYPKD